MGLLQDVKFGFRMLRRNPWLTVVAALTLAVGIGVNSTVFTLVNAVLLKDVPFENPHELVHIGLSDGTVPLDTVRMSYPDFVDIRSRAEAFKEFAAFDRGAPIDIADPGNLPERYPSAAITANLFSFMGIQPHRGRDFTFADERPGAEPVVLIGYEVWQNRYGGADDVLGRSIRISGKNATIIGVMPEGMKFPIRENIWVPLVPGADQRKRDWRNLDVLGRMAPGAALEQGRTELAAIARQLAQDHPATNRSFEPIVMTYSRWSNGAEIETAFLAMLGAVGFVLLIACTNVANLMLSNVARRTRETSIRAALGASRWRIVRQLLIESVMLSLLGGVFGFVLADTGIQLFDTASSQIQEKPYWADFGMDYRVFAYFLAVCVGTGLLFGLAPALQISRLNVNDNLKDGGRGVAGGVRARRLSTGLLVGEIALTVVLLVGAGLMVRSFLNMQRWDVGIATNGVVMAQVELPPERYRSPEDLLRFEERLTERIGAMGGAFAVTIASDAPGSGAEPLELRLEDRDIRGSDGRGPEVSTVRIADGYFRALDARLLQGREFETADGRPGAEAVIVNEPFAAKYWPGENPIGKRLQVGGAAGKPWLDVVGVSPAILQHFEKDLKVPTVYVPYRQNPVSSFFVLARGSAAADRIAPALRGEISALDADLPLIGITTLDDYLRNITWGYRLFGSVFSIFAFIALLMSSVGIYSVTAYGISQRTQEIGLRLALGATRQDVAWLVLRQGLLRIAAGLALGIIGALALSGAMQTLLYNVTPTDPLTFVLVTILLSAVTTAACLIPARRAMALDPAEALRQDG